VPTAEGWSAPPAQDEMLTGTVPGDASAPGAMRFGPELPSRSTTRSEQPVASDAPAADGAAPNGSAPARSTEAPATAAPATDAPTSDAHEDRGAFFAAFRAAAERAREEAGIDTRRVGR
jgi:hypothetical protein